MRAAVLPAIGEKVEFYEDIDVVGPGPGEVVSPKAPRLKNATTPGAKTKLASRVLLVMIPLISQRPSGTSWRDLHARCCGSVQGTCPRSLGIASRPSRCRPAPARQYLSCLPHELQAAARSARGSGMSPDECGWRGPSRRRSARPRFRRCPASESRGLRSR